MDRGVDAEHLAPTTLARWRRRTLRAGLTVAAVGIAAVLLLLGALVAVDFGLGASLWDVVDLGR
jgi:hypothetical protein